MEESVLGLLAGGALAPEQIAAQLRVPEACVRSTLESLRNEGHADVSTIRQIGGEAPTNAAHWRITDAGRARLEDLRRT